MVEQKTSRDAQFAAIAAICSVIATVIGITSVIQTQKIEFANNAATLARIEVQNDERAKGVESRLATIESRLMNLESKR